MSLTLKMPPFCQAIFSTVSPRMLVWSMPSEETPHTTGVLGTRWGGLSGGGGGGTGTVWGHRGRPPYLMMLVQS